MADTGSGKTIAGRFSSASVGSLPATVKLIKMLDGETVLARKDFAWEYTRPYLMSLEVNADRIKAWIGEELLFEFTDGDEPFTCGAVAIVCEEGRGKNGSVRIQPI